MQKKDVFRETILPSTGLPEKGSYNLREVSQMFGISQRTLVEYLKQGVLKLPVYRFAAGLRIYKTDLIKIFNETGVYVWDESESDTETVQ